MDATNNGMVYCYKCSMYTNTYKPIVINKTKNNQIKLSGICSKCNLTKSKFISAEIRKLLLYDLVFNTVNNRTFINNIETYNGKIIPIFPMVDPYINIY